ncbi:MAG: glycosyltransferase family 2 protein [Pseudomonadota bacterium]|nr:MAG: glycosyltransferase family 2 protein [Pseudomonadota bacterium]
MSAPGIERPEIAYCVPVMNRLADLKATLGHNLEQISEFWPRVRMIVACFDRSPECVDWIRKEFSSAIDVGHLELRQPAHLEFWHFGRAKNAFRQDFPARYYASLDGDNYLSRAAVAAELALIADDSQDFVIHHFSGRWGDGTSGRITLPGELYVRHGYLEEIFPRQFDEMGVILGLLARYPDLLFVSRPGVRIFELSNWSREFIARNQLRVRHRELDFGEARSPANPRGAGYVESDRRLYYFQNINASYTGYKRSVDEAAREWFGVQLKAWQDELSCHSACADVLEVMFGGSGMARLRRTADITLYAVNRNHFELLGPWLDHYRRLGVERFIVVDDGSDPPLETAMSGDDVFVVRPEFGQFRTSKVFWLKALMMGFQEPGSWVLTSDIDEFLDLPPVDNPQAGDSRLAAAIERAECAGGSECPGVLVDMMPPPGVHSVSRDGVIDTMDWHYWRPLMTRCPYGELGPVQWGFDQYWPVSLALDVRFRLFGTIDCLRKVPLFRFEPSVILNQGLHALEREGRQISAADLLQPDQPLYPLRHYKMARLFRPRREGADAFERVDQYFGRTQANMARMQAADRDYIDRVWAATPFKQQWQGPAAFPFSKRLADGLAALRGDAENAQAVPESSDGVR